MKILLTIFVKIPHNVIEVMVVLMVLLLALKFVQSGVYHACVGGHDIVYTPSFCWGGGGGGWAPEFFKGGGGAGRGAAAGGGGGGGGGGWTSKFFKRGGGLDQISIFREVFLGNRGWPFTRGCNFYIKSKIKFEIFNERKFTNKNVFLSHNWEFKLGYFN